MASTNLDMKALEDKLKQYQDDLYKLQDSATEDAGAIQNLIKQIVNVVARLESQVQLPLQKLEYSIQKLEYSIQLKELELKAESDPKLRDYLMTSISQLRTSQQLFMQQSVAAKSNAVSGDAEEKRSIDDEVKNGDDVSNEMQVASINQLSQQINKLRAQPATLYNEWQLNLLELQQIHLQIAASKNDKTILTELLKQQTALQQQKVELIKQKNDATAMNHKQHEMDLLSQALHNVLKNQFSATDLVYQFRNCSILPMKLHTINELDTTSFFTNIQPEFEKFIVDYNSAQMLKYKNNYKNKKQQQEPKTFSILDYNELDITQPFYSKHMIALFNQHSTNLKLVDTHKIATINNHKPDVIVSTQENNTDAVNIVIIGELKALRVNGNFVENDKAQLWNYALELSKIQTFRFKAEGDIETCHIQCFLSDVLHYQFFKIKLIRNYNSIIRSSNIYVYEIESSVIKNAADGCEYLHYLLNSKTYELGYDLPNIQISNITYPISKLLGCGASGSVFLSSHSGNPVVVKQFKRTEEIEREVNILKYLQQLEVQHICKVVAYDIPTKVMVMTPVGKTVSYKHSSLLQSITSQTSENQVQLNHIICLIDILEAIHSHKVVHRDIKQDNIILVGTGTQAKVFLVDFACSVILDAQDSMNVYKHQGSSIYCTDDVLGMLEQQNYSYVPTMAQDLFAVVIIFICYLDNSAFEIMKALTNNYSKLISYRHQLIRKFRAQGLVAAAEDGNHKELKNKMKALAGNIYADDEDEKVE